MKVVSVDFVAPLPYRTMLHMSFSSCCVMCHSGFVRCWWFCGKGEMTFSRERGKNDGKKSILSSYIRSIYKMAGRSNIHNLY